MDFWRTILVLFRRWYITVPAFMLALAAAGAMYVSRPIYYTSSSVLVLTAPVSGATARADPKQAVDLTNPLLNFDHGLSEVAAILVQALSSPEVSDQLGVRPGETSFQVTNGSTNPELLINGPFVVITGQSRSPGPARDLVARVAQRARQELVSQQQKLTVPSSTYIVPIEVVSPTTPLAQRGTRLRPAASALAVSFIASLAAAFGAESVLTRPGRRRRAQSAADGQLAVGAIAGSNRTSAAHAGRFDVVTAELPSGPAVRNGERPG